LFDKDKPAYGRLYAESGLCVQLLCIDDNYARAA
jgi:hypothetical protein